MSYPITGGLTGGLWANATHYAGSIRLDANALAVTDLDIEGDRMAVSWWAGLLLFNLSAAGQPIQVGRLDAYSPAAPFPSWLPPMSEVDQVFSSVAVPDGDSSFAALAGIQPGGVAVVDLTGAPYVAYQDSEQTVGGTIWAARVGGRSYAWAGTTAGVVGYDLTRTREAGCLRSCVGGSCSSPGPPCSGVRLPPFGGRTQYVAGVVTSAGRALLVRSSGVFFPKTIEVWDVSSPLAPVRVATLAGQAFGVGAWQHRDAAGTIYVAARRQADVRVYRLDLATGSLVDTGRAVPLHYPAETAQYLPLSFSWSGDVPFVFAGHADGCKEPSEPRLGYEALIRLADPHRPAALEAVDVSPRQQMTCTSWTSPPETPPMPQASRTVDYWSWYSPNHEWGWSSVWPRVARFHGRRLYRAAHTIGDIHVWTPPPPSGPPAIFADGFENGSASAWSARVP